MISWDTCKEDFRSDGSLRDIYISPATLADWQAIYPLVRNSPAAEFLVDGVVQSLPATVEQVLAVRPLGSPMLRLQVGRALVVFHFFTEDEIECDLSPDEVASQADLDTLLGFVSQLGDATRRQVAITPENVREQPFITYDPENKVFEHHKIAA